MNISKYNVRIIYLFVFLSLTTFSTLLHASNTKSGFYISASAAINAPSSRNLSSEYSALMLTHDVGDGVYRPTPESTLVEINTNNPALVGLASLLGFDISTLEGLNAFFTSPLAGQQALENVYISQAQSDKESGFVVGSSFSPAIALGYKYKNLSAEISYTYARYSFFNYRYNLIGTTILQGLNTTLQSSSINHTLYFSPSYNFEPLESVPVEITYGIDVGISFIEDTTKFNVSGIRYNSNNKQNSIKFKYGAHTGVAYSVSDNVKVSLNYRITYNPAADVVTINTNFFADGFVAGLPSPYTWPTKALGTVKFKKEAFMDHNIAFSIMYFI